MRRAAVELAINGRNTHPLRYPAVPARCLNIVAMLKVADVPHGKIYTAADIAADPQYLAREMIRQMTLSDGTSLKLPCIEPKLSDTPGEIPWVGTTLGSTVTRCVRSVGYSGDDTGGGAPRARFERMARMELPVAASQPSRRGWAVAAAEQCR
jgi:hypothetical protein